MEIPPQSQFDASEPSGGCAAIVLAAGKSTRMRSSTPKPLHRVCGVPITEHVIRACMAAGIGRIVVVVGNEAERVKDVLGPGVEYAVQESQRGTADAVMAASKLLADWEGTVLVLVGDMPLIRGESIAMVRSLQAEKNASLALLTAISEDATGYGRIIRDESNGRALRVVEERDATPEQRAINEWNPSVYVFQAKALWSSLNAVEPNNVQGEFYLTDTVQILADSGSRVEAVPVADAAEVMGVNTRVELALAGEIMRSRINRRHMLAGVTITDPANTYIDADVVVGQDTVLLPGTMLNGASRIGMGCTIGPGSLIDTSYIGADCTIGPSSTIRGSDIGTASTVVSSQIVDSTLLEGVRVGPFANLRPGTKLNNGVRIGDFVELKNSELEEGVQVNHLTYLGDSHVGAGTNVGAGTITCNYNGFTKSRTTIGRNAFIGSHSTLIAPVTIGDGAITAAGSVVAENVPDDALAIARPPLHVKESGAARYRNSKRNSKK